MADDVRESRHRTLMLAPVEEDENKVCSLPLAGASPIDQLGYVADLASELGQVASRLGLLTLSGLLDLSQREALVQIERCSARKKPEFSARRK